jgi:hypothetical protein
MVDTDSQAKILYNFKISRTAFKTLKFNQEKHHIRYAKITEIQLLKNIKLKSGIFKFIAKYSKTKKRQASILVEVQSKHALYLKFRVMSEFYVYAKK